MPQAKRNIRYEEKVNPAQRRYKKQIYRHFSTGESLDSEYSNPDGNIQMEFLGLRSGV